MQIGARVAGSGCPCSSKARATRTAADFGATSSYRAPNSGARPVPRLRNQPTLPSAAPTTRPHPPSPCQPTVNGPACKCTAAAHRRNRGKRTGVPLHLRGGIRQVCPTTAGREGLGLRAGCAGSGPGLGCAVRRASRGSVVPSNTSWADMAKPPASDFWWNAFFPCLVLAGICWLVTVPSEGLLEVVSACFLIACLVLAGVFMCLAGLASVAGRPAGAGPDHGSDPG
jgi:hypothetical protein